MDDNGSKSYEHQKPVWNEIFEALSALGPDELDRRLKPGHSSYSNLRFYGLPVGDRKDQWELEVHTLGGDNGNPIIIYYAIQSRHDEVAGYEKCGDRGKLDVHEYVPDALLEGIRELAKGLSQPVDESGAVRNKEGATK